MTQDLLSRLEQIPLADKLALTAGASCWRTHAVEAVGLPAISMADGPHGMRVVEGLDITTAIRTTAFPVEAMVGSTWSPELAYEMGRAIALEATWLDVDVILGPGLNGKRSPLGGRNFEYYSEDPYLSGVLAAATVEGIQSQGVGATLKHFIANEQETNRFRVNVVVGERALREIYLAPFEYAVKHAHPWLVMTSYNGVNGEACSSNRRLLVDILRREWGFDGVVVSDWGAVRDKVAAVCGGVDLEMPGPGAHQDSLKAAVASGQVSAETLDARVTALLRLAGRIEKRQVTPDLDAHHALAKRIAIEGTILLENARGVLPLREGVRLAVVGELARTPRFQAGGSSHLNPQQLDSALAFFKTTASVEFAPGYDDQDTDTELVAAAVAAARRAEAVVAFVGTAEATESEGVDRVDLQLPAGQLRLIEALAAANPNVVVVINAGSVVEVSRFREQVAAIVYASLPGEAGGSAIVDVLFGRCDPGGRLAETFPLMLEHNPSFESFPGDARSVEYREGILVGYRYYDTKKLPVRYPFGHGLSYATFAYARLKIGHEVIAHGGSTTVSCAVTNTSDRAGTEVVQLYVRDVASTMLRPEKELRAFRKVTLAPRQSTTVELILDARAFAHWSDVLGRFAVEAGDFEVLVGASSRDIRLCGRLRCESTDDLRLPLTLDDSLQAWLDDDRYRELGEKVRALMKAVFEPEAMAVITGAPIEANLIFVSQVDASRRAAVAALRTELIQAVAK